LVLRRYIIKEIFQALAAVMIVLLLIYVSNRFVRILADASSGGLSTDVIFTLLSLKTLTSLMVLLPLGLFLGILLAFGRLYKDNEMVAMAACGMSPKASFRAVLGFSLLMAALVGFISLQAAPWAEEQASQIRDQEKASSELTGWAPGRFIELDSIAGVIYAQSMAEGSSIMDNVFVQGREAQQQVILSAQGAYQTTDQKSGDQFMVLTDGFRYEGAPGNRDFKIIKYKKHGVRIDEKEVAQGHRRRRSYETFDLLESNEAVDLAELQWRLSMPISAVLLAMLAVPLSRTAPRQGKYAKLFAAIVIYIVYSNVMGIAKTWVERGFVHPWIGMWWVHVLMFVLIWTLLARQYGMGWLLRSVFMRPKV